VVEGVFTITGRGTVLTGTVESGSVTVGDAVTLTSPGGRARVATVTGVEAFRKRLTSAGEGEHVGLLLDGVGREDVERNTVVTR
jgi:elongation factor Tu